MSATCAVIGCIFQCSHSRFCNPHRRDIRAGIQLAIRTSRRGLRGKYGPTCNLAQCSRPHYSTGMCRSHYEKSRMLQNDPYEWRRPVRIRRQGVPITRGVVVPHDLMPLLLRYAKLRGFDLPRALIEAAAYRLRETAHSDSYRGPA